MLSALFVYVFVYTLSMSHPQSVLLILNPFTFSDTRSHFASRKICPSPLQLSTRVTWTSTTSTTATSAGVFSQRPFFFRFVFLYFFSFVFLLFILHSFLLFLSRTFQPVCGFNSSVFRCYSS